MPPKSKPRTAWMTCYEHEDLAIVIHPRNDLCPLCVALDLPLPGANEGADIPEVIPVPEKPDTTIKSPADDWPITPEMAAAHKREEDDVSGINESDEAELVVLHKRYVEDLPPADDPWS